VSKNLFEIPVQRPRQVRSQHLAFAAGRGWYSMTGIEAGGADRALECST
jgi:hypothetical protein